MHDVMRIKGDRVSGYYQIIREMREACRACEEMVAELGPEEFDEMFILGGPTGQTRQA